MVSLQEEFEIMSNESEMGIQQLTSLGDSHKHSCLKLNGVSRTKLFYP